MTDSTRAHLQQEPVESRDRTSEPLQPKRITDELDELIKLREETAREIDYLNRHRSWIDRIFPFRTSTS